MRITFVTRTFGNLERNSHCDVLHITPIRVARLFLDCNGDLAIKAYEDDELEVIWIKVMPKRLPRTVSCILIACIYYTQQTDYLKMREHIITSIDAVIRKHPGCGIIVTGDVNQLNDNVFENALSFCSDCKCRHTRKCGVR